MAILRIVNRGADRGTYAKVGRIIHLDHQHPPGLIMHGAVEVDGKMQVAQIWDSMEYAERFDEALRPALEAVGAAVDASVTVFRLEHLVTP